MRRSPVFAALAALLLALVLVGCSGGSGEDAAPGTAADTQGKAGGPGDADSGRGEAAPGGSQDASGEGGSGEGGRGGGAGADEGGTGGGSAGTSVGSLTGGAVTSAVARRTAAEAALIRTGELTVRVPDVSEAAEAAGRLAVAAGGSVESEERTQDGQEGGSDGSAMLVLRVPPRTFTPTLGRLAALGEELDRRVGTQDVTDQVVDLESRISTQRASVARVRALLDEAKDLGEVVQIEGELTRRTADLESLEARRAVLGELVDQSTITVHLHGGDVLVAAAAGPLGFDDGLAAGWRAVTAVARAVGVTVGALLPFAPLLLVAALVWRFRTRRARAV